jgi:hypothetical protein
MLPLPSNIGEEADPLSERAVRRLALFIFFLAILCISVWTTDTPQAQHPLRRRVDHVGDSFQSWVRAILLLKALLFCAVVRGLNRLETWGRTLALAAAWALMATALLSIFALSLDVPVIQDMGSILRWGAAIDIAYALSAFAVLLPRRVACRFK